MCDDKHAKNSGEFSRLSNDSTGLSNPFEGVAAYFNKNFKNSNTKTQKTNEAYTNTGLAHNNSTASSSTNPSSSDPSQSSGGIISYILSSFGGLLLIGLVCYCAIKGKNIAQKQKEQQGVIEEKEEEEGRSCAQERMPLISEKVIQGIANISIFSNPKNQEFLSQTFSSIYTVSKRRWAYFDDSNTNVKLGGVMSIVYSGKIERPTLEQALEKADYDSNGIKLITEACNGVTTKVVDEGTIDPGVTEHDAAAIAMYTYDFGNAEKSPYKVINKNLVGRNTAGLQKIKWMLYLLLTALRKLPRFSGKRLYRMVKSGVNLSKCKKGERLMWSAFTSTSISRDEARKFLSGSSSKEAISEGVMFIIDDGWGYSVQKYSVFPGEEEILLEPEREFEVVSKMKNEEGYTEVCLRMLDTPILLPQVFGDGKQIASTTGAAINTSNRFGDDSDDDDDSSGDNNGNDSANPVIIDKEKDDTDDEDIIVTETDKTEPLESDDKATTIN